MSGLPETLREYGFLGGLALGVAWAFDRIVLRRNGKRPAGQKLVTPQDVLAEVQSNRAADDAVRAADAVRFQAWHQEDIATHVRLDEKIERIEKLVLRLCSGDKS